MIKGNKTTIKHSLCRDSSGINDEESKLKKKQKTKNRTANSTEIVGVNGFDVQQVNRRQSSRQSITREVFFNKRAPALAHSLKRKHLVCSSSAVACLHRWMHQVQVWHLSVSKKASHAIYRRDWFDCDSVCVWPKKTT